MLQRKHLLIVLLVMATLAWATQVSAQEATTTTADQNGDFSDDTFLGTTNCTGKLKVEILKDENGAQVSANVDVTGLRVSQIGSSIKVTYTGSLTDSSKAGNFWIKVTKECQFTITTYKRSVIVNPPERR